MKRWMLFCLLLAACAKGQQADLQYVSEARSLAAEWALINDHAVEARLTDIYRDAMRRQLREQLRTVASSLTVPHSRYGAEINALLSEPADAPASELRAHSDKLRQIEDSLESA